MKKMTISKKSFGEYANEVKVEFLGFSSVEAAKKLDFDVETPVFLQMSANRDLFNLENGHTVLLGEFREFSNRNFEVSFHISEYTNHFLFEYTVREARLKISEDFETFYEDSQVLWRENFRVKVLESDYDDKDTQRVIYEFCASIALMIRDILA